MEENAVLVLFDLCGHFEKRKDHGRGLGRGQGGMGERVGAKRMMQDIGRTRQQEPHGVGQEGRGRRAVAVEVILHRLDIVFAIAAGAIEVFIHMLRCGASKEVTTKRGLSPAAMTSALSDDPPRLRPGGCGIAELLIEAATGQGAPGHGRAPGRSAAGGDARASCRVGAAWRSKTALPARPNTKSVQRRWAITSMTSGVAK